MKRLFLATAFILAVGTTAPVLADDGFDPSAIILANASDQPVMPRVSEKEAQLWVLTAGYNQVSALTRDTHSLYHGTALLNGETYDIVVDSEGNILGAKQ